MSHVMGGGEKKPDYLEEPLNSKVIKSFLSELKSRKCFSCFEIPMFYVIYIYEHYMSISHIAVSGYGTHLITSKHFQ